MKGYSPTIEELNGKTRTELSAIFRKASSETESQEPSERRTAQETLEKVRVSFIVRGPTS